MHKYLAIQQAEDIIEIGLFYEDQCVDVTSENKQHTSKFFLLLLEQLLSRNALNFADMAFCAVNCGPGPFSTIRSILASVNGLHCATGIPLISIDGLEARFIEFRDPTRTDILILVDAFNDESYYLRAFNDQIITTGYKKKELLYAEIEQEFQNRDILIIDQKSCSIETIARIGYKKYGSQEKSAHDYLAPLYLKKHPVEQNQNN